MKIAWPNVQWSKNIEKWWMMTFSTFSLSSLIRSKNGSQYAFVSYPFVICGLFQNWQLKVCKKRWRPTFLLRMDKIYQLYYQMEKCWCLWSIGSKRCVYNRYIYIDIYVYMYMGELREFSLALESIQLDDSYIFQLIPFRRKQSHFNFVSFDCIIAWLIQKN